MNFLLDICTYKTNQRMCSFFSIIDIIRLRSAVYSSIQLKKTQTVGVVKTNINPQGTNEIDMYTDQGYQMV